MKNASRIICIALVVSSLGISACNINPDGSFGNITGPQGPQGIPGENGTTNISLPLDMGNVTDLVALNTTAFAHFGNTSNPHNTTVNQVVVPITPNPLSVVGQRLTMGADGNVTWAPPSAAGSHVYYFQNTSANYSYYKQLLTTIESTKTTNTTASVANNQTVASFITNTGVPGLSIIPAGAFEFHIHASQTAGTKTATLHAELWETAANGTDIAMIGMAEPTSTLTPAELEYDIVFVNNNPYTLNSTASRILVRIHAFVTGAGTDPTINQYWGGIADAFIAFPSVTVTADNFVPYTSANRAVDLGSYNLTTTGNISSGNFYTTAIGWFNQFLLNLSGNVTALINNLAGNWTYAQNTAGNLSSNYTAWTQNDSNLSGNLSLKLDTANVSTIPSAGKVLATDANATVDKGVTRYVDIKLIADNSSLLVENPSEVYWTVPAEFDGWKVVSVAAFVYASSSSGLPTFGLFNIAKGVSICSTNITIDTSENTSYTATTAAVINTSNNTLNIGDQIRFDTRVAGTSTKGAEILLGIRYP